MPHPFDVSPQAARSATGAAWENAEIATFVCRASGSRSSTTTSTPTSAPPTSAAPSAKGVSSAQRPRRACAPCRCRRSRSTRSSVYRAVPGASYTSPTQRPLLRPAQLPQPQLETRARCGWDRAATTHLRSTAHLRDLRTSCRYLHLRSLPLNGCQPDQDRPPLRPPCPRRA